jgi:outer membrane murein-binding lipoprotein Lpp
MMTSISGAIAYVRAVLKQLHVQKLLAAVVMSAILLIGNVSPGSSNEALGKAVRDRVNQVDQSDRPKTTGEWQQEARETEGQPGKRIERVAKESGQAFKQFGSNYVEGTKEAAGDLGNQVTGN